MKNLKKYFIFLLLLTVSALGFITKSYADFVSPTKVYIQDGQTSASIAITNNTDDPMVYTFDWERRVRSEDGTNVKVLQEGETYPGYRPADPYLIYSPRKVVVDAHETQRVRILAQRPKDMAPGEYRSHLKITSDRTVPEEQAKAGPGELAGVITINPALSIPVMLRTGKTVIDIKIAGSTIGQSDNQQVVNVSMINNSTRSVYGNGSLRCKTPDGQETKAKTNGFRLYAETKTFNEKFVIPEAAAPSKCSSLELDLFVANEPEYTNHPIATVKLK